MSLNGSIKVYSTISQSNPNLSFGLPQTTQLNPQFVLPAVPGTAGTADNADKKFSDELLFTSGTSQVLDLTSLTDQFGNSFSFTRIRSILIEVISTTDGQTVTLGYSSSTANAWTSLLSNPGQLTLGASTATNSGALLLISPNTTGWVVSSTNRLLQFTPSSGTFSIRLEIMGCSV